MKQPTNPDIRIDITGPGTAVLTNIMGQRRVVLLRRQKRRRDGPWMRLAKRIVPAVMWLIGMWMVYIVVVALVLGGW